MDLSTILSSIFVNYWYIGALSAICSAISAAMGDILTRYSFVYEESLPESERRILLLRPYWLCGMTLTIILNPLITLFAYSFTAASVIMPFVGLQIILSLVFAHFILGEHIRIIDYVAFGIISVGITVALFCGAKYIKINTDEFSITDAYIAYNAILGISLAICICLSLPINPLIFWTKLQRFCITAVSGLAGAACCVSAKGGILLIEIAASGEWFKYFNPYLVGNIFVCISMAIIQVFYLNWALLRYPATFVVPVVNSVLIAVGSTGAIIVYQETPRNSLGFILGVIAVIIGIIMLSHASNDRTHCSIRGPREINKDINNLQKHILMSQASTAVNSFEASSISNENTENIIDLETVNLVDK
ncbi:hypothetical protein cand_017850 [Cryptosporidium andersoni]|uniref:Uncharacterized protein n=1 Tax=Cryptosporidium andersoni TaxID=117008 RepID=A0A1J4MK77_9CRYT|nr:hypothetical protein cand_017850 [Cryptosporidium andersoni]